MTDERGRVAVVELLILFKGAAERIASPSLPADSSAIAPLGQLTGWE